MFFDINEFSKLLTLSEQFDYIDKYTISNNIDKGDWDYINKYQKLSEEFIEKYSDKLDWNGISKYQDLSEGFIERHINKLDIKNILKNKNINKEVLLNLYKKGDEQEGYLLDKFNEEFIDLIYKLKRYGINVKEDKKYSNYTYKKLEKILKRKERLLKLKKKKKLLKLSKTKKYTKEMLNKKEKIKQFDIKKRKIKELKNKDNLNIIDEDIIF